jgi:hypothetical protein
MSERNRPEEPLLDLPDDGSLTGEHLDSQVQKAQEQLLSLKRQQDAIERQKRELEELSRRQEQLNAGKSEMVEKFTRAMVVLERETYDAQKRLELLHSVGDSFNGHLDILESINPKAWEGLDINREITKALSAVDDSKAEYQRSMPKIASVASEGSDSGSSSQYHLDYGESEEKDFVYWIKAGLAFTLPLSLVGLLIALALFSQAR